MRRGRGGGGVVRGEGLVGWVFMSYECIIMRVDGNAAAWEHQSCCKL